MKYKYKNIRIVILFSFLLASPFALVAQKNVKQLLIRDSLDFASKQIGVNSKANDYNPIPYKGGLLFVSNKQTSTNQIGLNKVYWVPNNEISVRKTDSLSSKVKLNDDFTAPTSNDNNILTRYSRKRDMAKLNEVEKSFANFNPTQAFTLDSSNIIIYAKLGTKKMDHTYKWELWQANLENGKLKQDKKIAILDSNADYLYPNLSSDGNTLYFASNRKGGKGGFDIYSLNKLNGVWDNKPMPIESINSTANEIYPVDGITDFNYTSDRSGGMGGYDVYSYNKGTKKSSNLGYPINTSYDDLGMNKQANNYYLARNANQSIDLAIVNYNPVYIPVSGQLVYQADGEISANQKMYIKDNDEGRLIDSIYIDANANYKFIAKPNRNYTIIGKNADGFVEEFPLVTNDKVAPMFAFAMNLKGRSPKQIKDSISYALLLQENRRKDSLAAISLEQKFIVRYGFDKSTLVAKEKLVLDSLMNKLNALPNAYIVVGAFTDCIGSYKYNYNLSVKRAKFVVNYLIKKGLNKNRIVSNGYSKNYTVTPCTSRYNKTKQLDNRRAEIVLSETKNTNWANLQKLRGDKYYTVYNSSNNFAPVKKTMPLVAKAKTLVPNKPTIVKVDSVKATVIKPVVEKAKLDTLVTANVKASNNIKKPKLLLPSKNVTPPSSVPNVIIANQSTYKDEDLSKEEIVKALDSLAKLKREQERIVEYLTKRINKKPIDVYVSSDSVTIEIYDNAIHDKDSVSIIYNNRIVVDRQELKVNKPIKFMLKVEKNKKYNELVMVAENLGTDPPNTAVMFVTEKSGRRQQVMLATDMTHNEVIYFIRIGKE